MPFDVYTVTREGSMREQRVDDGNVTTTIAIHKSTKSLLDKNKAPGQCYNGFICQLLYLWEKTKEDKLFVREGSVEGNPGT